MNNYALIYSYKELLNNREEYEKKFETAVICSSYPMEDKFFDWIPNRCILEFMNTSKDCGDAFQPEQAKKIAELMKTVKDGDTVIFCCDGGDSISPALAAAFMRAQKGDEMEIWTNPYYRPNPLVYKRQCEAFGIMISDSEINDLVKRNEIAKSERIRRNKEKKFLP